MQKHLFQTGGLLSFTRCKSNSYGNGGGLYVRGKLIADSGTMTFRECVATHGGGGGAAVSLDAHIHNTNMTFKECSSTWRGAKGGGL